GKNLPRSPRKSARALGMRAIIYIEASRKCGASWSKTGCLRAIQSLEVWRASRRRYADCGILSRILRSALRHGGRQSGIRGRGAAANRARGGLPRVPAGSGAIQADRLADV